MNNYSLHTIIYPGNGVCWYTLCSSGSLHDHEKPKCEYILCTIQLAIHYTCPLEESISLVTLVHMLSLALVSS